PSGFERGDEIVDSRLHLVHESDSGRLVGSICRRNGSHMCCRSDRRCSTDLDGVTAIIEERCLDDGRARTDLIAAYDADLLLKLLTHEGSFCFVVSIPTDSSEVF